MSLKGTDTSSSLELLIDTLFQTFVMSSKAYIYDRN